MVEYKKKKIILQSGGTRNFYYKISSNGKKKQVSKREYLEKKGGHKNNPNNNNWEAPPIISMNNINNLGQEKKQNERSNIKILTPNEEKFLSNYNPNNPSNVNLLERLKKDFLTYVDKRKLSNTYRNEHLKKYSNYQEYKRIQTEKQEVPILPPRIRKLELKGNGHQISKNSGYIPSFNYPGLAIKQSLENMKLKNPSFKKKVEYLIQKIEEHEKNGYYHWWTPCLLEKGYKENMNKCKGNRNQNQKEIFSDLENLFFHIPNQTEAIIESLKKENKDKFSIEWAEYTIKMIKNISHRYIGVGNNWWLPCAMCN